MMEKLAKTVHIKNKRASFEYEFIETFVAGIVLKGTEIKSIRQSKVNLTDAYCVVMNNEVFIKKLHISVYEQASFYNHDPLNDRKLLLSKKEIKKINVKLIDKGISLIPTRLFINDRGFAKIEIALAKGKKLHDKRDSIKERDIERETKSDIYRMK